MKFQARTVFLLVGLSIILSSIATYIVIGMNPNQEGLPQLSQAEDITKSDGKKSTGNVEEKFNKIAEAYKVISENYVLEVDEEKLLEGAIEGMLNTLEDPYSVYMDPEAAEQFKSSLQSSFEGIGAEVMIQNGRVTIVAPIRNAPAEKAGLRPNDRSLASMEKTLKGWTCIKRS